MTRAESLRPACFEEVAWCFKVALQGEDYATCAVAKAEIDRRIDEGTLEIPAAIDAFRQPFSNWMPFYGGYGGLFDRLQQLYPEHYTPEAALLYGAKLQLRMEAAWPAYRSKK